MFQNDHPQKLHFTAFLKYLLLGISCKFETTLGTTLDPRLP